MNKKRLTIRTGGENNILTVKGKTSLDNIIEKLAYYEDKEQNGELIDLPFKVGDIVFQPYKNMNDEFTYGTIENISIEIKPSIRGYKKQEVCVLYAARYPNVSSFGFRFFDFEIGETVFRTEELAKIKWEELTKIGEENKE